MYTADTSRGYTGCMRLQRGMSPQTLTSKAISIGFKGVMLPLAPGLEPKQSDDVVTSMHRSSGDFLSLLAVNRAPRCNNMAAVSCCPWLQIQGSNISIKFHYMK